MKRLYCTYFDHRYLAKGLAMIRSLQRFEPQAVVWILCLDDDAHDVLSKLGLPSIEVIRMSDFEREDDDLRRAKADGRSLVEYYFTLTPSLVKYVMEKGGDADMVTYLDGDLCFFAPVVPIYEEMGDASVLVIPHRFPETLRHKEKYGFFNVGWLSFRNDSNARICLEWWRERSNEWCRDWVDEENDRFCEQRYLDRVPKLFRGVHILRHKGANLAPWNLSGHLLQLRNGRITVDGDELIFFHFHGVRHLFPNLFTTVHQAYGAKLTPLMRKHLYRPYLQEVRLLEEKIAPYFLRKAGGDLRRDQGGLRYHKVFRAVKALVAGSAVWAPSGNDGLPS